MEKITLLLINLKTLEIFEKEFDTEFERDKFRERLKYSHKLKPLQNYYLQNNCKIKIK